MELRSFQMKQEFLDTEIMCGLQLWLLWIAAEGLYDADWPSNKMDSKTQEQWL